jgi:hypothetical protein
MTQAESRSKTIPEFNFDLTKVWKPMRVRTDRRRGSSATKEVVYKGRERLGNGGDPHPVTTEMLSSKGTGVCRSIFYQRCVLRQGIRQERRLPETNEPVPQPRYQRPLLAKFVQDGKLFEFVHVERWDL